MQPTWPKERQKSVAISMQDAITAASTDMHPTVNSVLLSWPKKPLGSALCRSKKNLSKRPVSSLRSKSADGGEIHDNSAGQLNAQAATAAVDPGSA
jgi:hypothetical protein